MHNAKRSEIGFVLCILLRLRRAAFQAAACGRVVEM